MTQETEITIDAIGAGPQSPEFDSACKEAFMNKEIIAPVLKGVVPEYKDCTMEKVVSCINAASIVSDPVDDVSAALGSSASGAAIPGAPVLSLSEPDPTLTDLRIDAMPTEMSSITEKLIRYDVRFKAVNPMLSSGTIRFFLHIDLEVQNNYRPGYPIIKRGEYYAARELSSQLSVLTDETNYNALQKVYSIWICNRNIPENMKNTVTLYSFTKKDIIGTVNEPESNYDLMNVIIINFRLSDRCIQQ